MYRKRSKNVPLVAAIAKAGITGRQLARRCHLHPVTISAAVNNRVTPSAETQRLIATALAASPEVLWRLEVSDE